MGQISKKQVGPRLGQGEQNPSLDPNLSPSLFLLSHYLLIFLFLNAVSLGLENSKPHRTPFVLSNSN